MAITELIPQSPLGALDQVLKLRLSLESRNLCSSLVERASRSSIVGRLVALG
jgi:hypothetical protein